MPPYKIFEVFEKLSLIWERKSGLIGSIVLGVGLFFLVGDYFLEEDFDKLSAWNLLFIGPVIISIWGVWMISTSRFVLKGKKEIVIVFSVNFDDQKEDLIIKKVIKIVLRRLENLDVLKYVKIKTLPANFFNTKAQAEKYILSNSNNIDWVFWLVLESGKYEDIDKIKVSEFTIITNTDPNHKNYNLYFNSVDLKQEIGVRNFFKNWEIVESNIGNEKDKIVENIFDLFVHIIGLSLILYGKYELALEVLKKIYKRLEGIKIEKEKGLDSLKVKVNPRGLVSERLAALLIDLFHKVAASEHMNNPPKAYQLLKECEELSENHPNVFTQLLALAKVSYLVGKLEDAKNYTAKADKISNNIGQKVMIQLNYGFFAIKENNSKNFIKHYTTILEKYRDFKPQNRFIDVADFLNREKEKGEDPAYYYDLALAYINLFYLDKVLGYELINEIKPVLETEKRSLFHFANRIERIARKTSKKGRGKKKNK